MKFELSRASEKGRRPYQEDRYVVYWVPEEGYLLGVFDGHGGSEAAEICQTALIPLYHEIRQTQRAILLSDIPAKIMCVNTENLLSNLFFRLQEKTQDLDSGCAASIAFIPKHGEAVVVGVLGDAPVLVRKANGDLWLAPAHNVRSNPAEAELAKARGGMVSGGYLFSSFSGGGLQMSRALGDVELDRVLSREPEIFRLETGSGSFVLVASDGLFDPSHRAVSSSLSDDFSREVESGATAETLAARAVALPTNDNVTAILVRFSEEK